VNPLSACRQLLGAALDLVASPVCLACGKEPWERHGLGARCLRLAPPRARAPCPRCAAPLGPGVDCEACPTCRDDRPRYDAAVAGGPYAGFLGELLRRAKYGGDVLLMRPLAERLREAVTVWPRAADVEVVVPVPGVPARERERGFNPARALAAPLARALAVPLQDRVLVRVGDPGPQAALPRTDRRLAARGTVAHREPGLWRGRPQTVVGRTVLLVDDVLTTGATANACVRALRSGGAARILVAVATRA